MQVITPSPAFTVVVRDIYCGIKNHVEEIVEVMTENEAKQWAQQFRKEYPSDAGYSVKIRRTA